MKSLTEMLKTLAGTLRGQAAEQAVPEFETAGYEVMGDCIAAFNRGLSRRLEEEGPGLVAQFSGAPPAIEGPDAKSKPQRKTRRRNSTPAK